MLLRRAPLVALGSSCGEHWRPCGEPLAANEQWTKVDVGGKTAKLRVDYFDTPMKQLKAKRAAGRGPHRVPPVARGAAAAGAPPH